MGHSLSEIGLVTGPKEIIFLGCQDNCVESVASTGFVEVWDQVNGRLGEGADFSSQSCKFFDHIQLVSSCSFARWLQEVKGTV